MKNTFALVSYVKHEKKKKMKMKKRKQNMKQNNNETKMGTPSVILFFLVKKKIFLTERFNVPLFEYEFQHDFIDE